MSLRVKLLAMFTLVAVIAIGVMDWGVERYGRQQFQEVDRQRSSALVAQFMQELQQRGQEVTSGVQGVADAESTTRMVLDLSRPQSDASIYANDARGLAEAHQLDYLELANNDGTLISVAQWPQQIGYKNDWVTREKDWNRQGAFLDRVELADGVDLGLLTVRMVHVADQNFYIIGGRRLDRDFLKALELPAGMRALLYRNLEDEFVAAELLSVDGTVSDSERFAPLVESLKTPTNRQANANGQANSAAQAPFEQKIQWTADPASAEKFVSVPLAGRHGELLGALLLGSSQSGLVSLLNYVRELALVIAIGAILAGFLMSWWISARVSRPLTRLASGIENVAGGDWDAQIDAGSGGEVGSLLRAFNRMTDRLTEERDRVLTAERVSAWREMALHLASEVQAGIMPLQKAVEQLGAAREQAFEGSDEVSSESLATLRVELRILQAAAEGLTEFSRQPAAHFEKVRINDIVRAAIKSFEPQFYAIGRPPITPELYLDDEVTPVQGDPVRLRKVIESLLYRALVDMSTGGTITIRTQNRGNMMHLVLSDMGRGFEIENPGRLFSMRPANEVGRGSGKGEVVGEGLILATVQAIVNDHGGRISVESAPGAGTTFFVDLPAVPAEKKTVRRSSKRAAAVPKSAHQAVETPREAMVGPSSQSNASDAAAGPISEVAAELTLELALEPPVEPALEQAAETGDQLSQGPAAKMEENLGGEGRAEESVTVAGETQPETETMGTETAPRAAELAHGEVPVEVPAEVALEGQSEFWDGAPQAIPTVEPEGSEVLEGSMAEPGKELSEEQAEAETKIQSQEQTEERIGEQSEASAPSPLPSLLNTLEEMLEAVPEAEPEPAPEEVPEKAAEQIPVKTLEKEIWRSPLTYR